MLAEVQRKRREVVGHCRELEAADYRQAGKVFGLLRQRPGVKLWNLTGAN